MDPFGNGAWGGGGAAQCRWTRQLQIWATVPPKAPMEAWITQDGPNVPCRVLRQHGSNSQMATAQSQEKAQAMDHQQDGASGAMQDRWEGMDQFKR